MINLSSLLLNFIGAKSTKLIGCTESTIKNAKKLFITNKRPFILGLVGSDINSADYEIFLFVLNLKFDIFSVFFYYFEIKYSLIQVVYILNCI